MSRKRPDDDLIELLDDEAGDEQESEQGKCEACHNRAAGHVYTFWGGYRSEGPGSLGDLQEDSKYSLTGEGLSQAFLAVAVGGVFGALLMKGASSKVYSYRNVKKLNTFVCNRCARNSFLLGSLLPIPAGLAPGFILAIFGLAMMWRFFRVGLVMLLISFALAACGGALTMAYAVFRLLRGPRSQSDRERIAIRLLKHSYRGKHNWFWTTTDYKKWRRHVY